MFRSVILGGICDISNMVENSLQLVDTLVSVLKKFRNKCIVYDNDQNDHYKNDTALLECIMASAEVLSDLSEAVSIVTYFLF